MTTSMTPSASASTASTALTTPRLAGVFAALPTPFDAAGALFPAAVAPLLDHAAALGCHGALLAGSTGEGPSLAHEERIALIAAAAAWRSGRPADASPFTLLCGSGVPAWPDAARATAAVVDAGADAAVVLPPYFFKGVGEDGLFDWFRRVIDGAGRLLGAERGDEAGAGRPLRVLAYDISRHTGVPIPTAVLVRLRAEFGPDGPFVGLKDSTGDAALTRERVAALPGAAVFTGTDTHLRAVLDAGGAGSITALASVRGDLARRVWDAHAAYGGRSERAERSGGVAAGADDVAAAQADLDAARAALDRWPAVQAIKAALAVRLGGEGWWVRAPLGEIGEGEREGAARALADGFRVR
ncbi:MAG: dihydrodipicolinate synthase family protein [Ardenticatenales bacterium]